MQLIQNFRHSSGSIRSPRLGLIAALASAWFWSAGLAHAQEAMPEASGPEIADALPEPLTYETARGLAMGSGARAGAVGSSAAAYNPAALTLARVYHVESIAGYFPDSNLWALGGSAVDSITNSLAVGFAARGLLGGDDSSYNGYDLRLSAGMPLSDRIGLGVTGRYVRLRNDAQEGAADQGLRRLTVDAALRVSPTDFLHIAVLGYNLVRTDSSLAPQQVGGSIAIDTEGVFSLAGDLLVDLTTFDSARVLGGGGLEFLAGGSVPLRAGYRYDSGRQLHSVTAGIGYVDQVFGADFSLRKDVTGDKATQLLVSVRYHVQ